MATGGDPTITEEDFRHTCSLCMEPYRGRIPKILPCFHTFCLPCLMQLKESVTTATTERHLEVETRPTEATEQSQSHSKTDETTVEEETVEKRDSTSGDGDVTNDSTNVSGGHNDTEKVVFLCPTCRAPVNIPDGGVAALQVRCSNQPANQKSYAG